MVVCFGQKTSFDKLIDRTIQNTVPLISSFELASNYEHYLVLDTREFKEYKTSHLKNAVHVGYTNFDLEAILNIIDNNKPIVVYCTIGYRSEKIAEKLTQKGLAVHNLRGGIIKWKNDGLVVVNDEDLPTEFVHCYNKEWSKWLLKGTKVYD